MVYTFRRAYIYNRRAKRRDFTIRRQRFLNVPLRHSELEEVLNGKLDRTE